MGSATPPYSSRHSPPGVLLRDDDFLLTSSPLLSFSPSSTFDAPLLQLTVTHDLATPPITSCRWSTHRSPTSSIPRSSITIPLTQILTSTYDVAYTNPPSNTTVTPPLLPHVTFTIHGSAPPSPQNPNPPTGSARP
jgi:hypothetical protein